MTSDDIFLKNIFYIVKCRFKSYIFYLINFSLDTGYLRFILE